MQIFLKKSLSRVLAALLLVTTIAAALMVLPLVPAKAAVFADTDSHWARGAIDRWVDLGVLNGVSEFSFAPERPITRAEFLAIINRAFGATQSADISRFTDVSSDSWYYDEIAVAYRMGTTNGTSATQMSPNSNISRQDAVVLLARALGISSSNTAALQRYMDAGNVASYAQPHVAAFVSLGYLNGYDGSLDPLGVLSRSQAVTILDNIFNEVAEGPEHNGSNGTLLVRTPGLTISGVINGDLVIADGVGSGDVYIENCTIQGQLIIRGGGENSIHMTDSSVNGGVYVKNPNSTTRLVLDDSDVGDVTAFTSLIIDGDRANSITVPPDTTVRPQLTISSGTVNSFNAAAPSDIQLLNGTIGSLSFYEGSDGSSADIASGTRITKLNINAQNISVNGSGSVSNLSVNSDGATVHMSPQAYHIGDNLSAQIGGVTRYGKTTSTSGSNFERNDPALYVTQNSSQTGGNGIVVSNSSGNGTNSVYVSQSGSTLIPLSTKSGRLAYWIGYFIPQPGEGTATPTVTYNFDGDATKMNMSLTYKNGQRGIEIAVPVKRDSDGSLKGTLETELFINWNSGLYETLSIMSGSLNLQASTASEEATLISYYTNAVFSAYNGTVYSGKDAIRRLIASDNPLGLDTRGFTTINDEGIENIAETLNSEASQLTTRTAIQERLMLAIAGEGALFGINRAMTAEQAKNIFEMKDFGYQIGLDDAVLSKYFTLSQVGRLSVAREVLLARGSDFENEQALIDEFLKNVDEVRENEVKLLTSINAARTNDEMKKLLENKTSYALLDIIIDGDPYKSLAAEDKTAVMTTIFLAKPFKSLDAVHDKFIELAGTATEIDIEKVLSVTTTTPTITVEVGLSAEISHTVTTSKGTDTSTGAVSFDSNKTSVAFVDDKGTVNAVGKGSATITVTSTMDSTKKATVTVNVVEPVDATGITLASERMEIAAGGTLTARAILTPATSTSQVEWFCDDESIATVEGKGVTAAVSGLKPGVTNITARTPREGLSAYCTVVVFDTTPGVAVYPGSITVGIGTKSTLEATVSPITQSNKTVTWKSENPAVAIVNSQGVVTGVAAGTTKITATSAYGHSGSAEVVVDPNLKAISLTKTSMTLYRGGTESIVATIASGTSSDVIAWEYDSRYISVEEAAPGKALVTGVAGATTKLIASLRDDPSVTAVCDIVVNSTTVNMTIPATSSMKIGDENYLNVTFTPNTIENKQVAWSTDKADVVSVDPATGRLYALKAGKARITAIPQANQSVVRYCDITVTEVPVTSVTVPPEYTIVLGDEIEIRSIISIAPTNATFTLAANSDYDGAVRVDGEKLIANKTTYSEREKIDPNTGQVVVDALGQPVKEKINTPAKVFIHINGKSYTCNVTVTENSYAKIEAVEINSNTWVYPVGAQQNLKIIYNSDPTAEMPSNTKVTWSSQFPEIASVNESGLLICHKPGITEITVKTQDGAMSNTKTFIVADYGVSSVTFGASFGDQKYGRWIQMDVGSTEYVGVAAFTSSTRPEASEVIWSSNNPNIVKVENGKLTAVSPGWATITVQPAMRACYGSVTLGMDSTRIIKNESEVLDGLHSALKTDGQGNYYKPNDIIGQAGINPLPTDVEIPLVIKNEITNGTNVFRVFVSPYSPDMSVTLEQTGGAAEVGKEFTLTATLSAGDSYDPDNNASVKWENMTKDATIKGSLSITSQSDRTNVGKASATFKAMMPGEYTIQVSVKVQEITGTNGLKIPETNPLIAEYTVIVQEIPLEGLTITGIENNGVVYKGEKVQLVAEATPANASYSDVVSWTSSNDMVLSVNNAGLVTSHAESGTAVITAETSNNTTATIRLFAGTRAPVSSVTLSETEKTLAFTEEFTLTATVAPSTAVQTVTWSIGNGNGNSAILERDNTIPATNLSMNFIAIGNGTTTITVTADGGLTATCTVTVGTAVQGSSAQIRAPIVTAPAEEKKSEETKTPAEETKTPAEEEKTPVEVKNPPESITLRKTAGVAVGKTITLDPFVTPADADKKSLKWTSSNPDVAAVEGGIVTGLKDGTAKITVKDAAGKLTAECTVTVKTDSTPVTSISLSKKSLTLNAGATTTLSVSYKPSSATIKGVTWTSEDESIARIDPNGKVTAVSGGTVKLTAVSDSGARVAVCTVTVKVPVTSVNLPETKITLKVGQTYQLKPVVNPINATDVKVTYSTRSSTIATVSSAGVITARKTGSTTITVKVGGKAVTCTVTVEK